MKKEEIIKIEENILKFKDEQRKEIIEYYLYESLNYLLGRKMKNIEKNTNCTNDSNYDLLLMDRSEKVTIRNKEIFLLFSLKKFINSDLYDKIEDYVIKIKIFQVQTFILDNNKINLIEKKKHFSKVSKWMKIIISDLRDTFLINTNSHNDNDVINAKSNKDNDKNNNIDNNTKFKNTDTNIDVDNNELTLFKKVNDQFIKLISMIFLSDQKFNSGANQILIDLYYFYKCFGNVNDNGLNMKLKNNFMEDKVLKESEILKIINKQ